ncbi:tRNA (adenosine(37)-N6)-dimethylallyltransferase MiaA [Cellulophaga sp. E16_2]|uniref:tRNA (adenosine(37)-N6)-dimethylallyltransferase MiaA n=1 Tax=Cellulophaga sp. E16_2 TaxID=2789297 RepID=UPI001A923ABD|nr:tRNA (adenosine(37)-N6)-dimethylallyltransferase MiaA [Cellulophaga sp. E16_2]MBO0593861.1 tRNA (adenosine(37)-N6)-dimethylallyltransferase MiaA [Cellulophaga sp. E16_2]
MEKTLISVVGPTAIGKTKLAIALAKHYNTEIISADSRQFFKEMNIGTAVPTKEELAAAPHHFIQHKSISEPYSVGDFERDATTKLDQLFKTNTVVIMVGGSGLYVDAVTKGLDHFPVVEESIRQKLNEELAEKSIITLQEQLQDLDPDYFKKVDLHNPHRLVRALEICIGTGKPYSSFLNKDKNKRPFKTITIGIEADRAMIYERINLRVDLMIKAGLIDEVKSLIEYKALNALQTVGYKEIFNYFDGLWELDFAISEIKKNTRRFAKRQLTWFRKATAITWVDFDEKISDVVHKIENNSK